MPIKDIDARKKYERMRYRKNRMQILAARKKYREENHDKVLKCQRECYRKNPSVMKEYQKKYYVENQAFVDARNTAYAQANKETIKSWQRGHRIKNLKKVLVYSAKRRAAKQGVPFDLSPDDFEIPTHCPVFGFKLEVGNRGFSPQSPSIDRIHPKLGYVKSNIQVISYRANELKRDASLEELKKLVAFLQED